MIHNDQELEVTKERIRCFHQQGERLRQVEQSRRIISYQQGAFLRKSIG